jgi:hypothetical protein
MRSMWPSSETNIRCFRSERTMEQSDVCSVVLKLWGCKLLKCSERTSDLKIACTESRERRIVCEWKRNIKMLYKTKIHYCRTKFPVENELWERDRNGVLPGQPCRTSQDAVRTGRELRCNDTDRVKPKQSEEVRVQILTAASMKMTVCWDMVQCGLGLAEIGRCFRGAHCLRHHSFVAMRLHGTISREAIIHNRKESAPWQLLSQIRHRLPCDWTRISTWRRQRLTACSL